jgi:NAD(P)-dependent dehydrogenase (short-subunit alcohol dehydrogenase family)
VTVVGSMIDTALDLSVVGGYTNVGYRVRSRGWGPLPRMDGKAVLITGATSGLGLAAAQRFAGLGATVWLAVRDRRRGEHARAQVLEHAGQADVRVELCDLSSLTSVRRFAKRFAAAADRLDVLVNNAGVLTQERELSADGIELTLATNVIVPFLLTELLIPVLEHSTPARIVNVSSGGMYTQRLQVEDLQSEHGAFDGPTAYARTKRAEVVLTELWATRLAGSGITVHAMHPGWADTPGVQASLPRFHRVTRPLLRSPAEGADTIVWLGAAPEPAHSSGGFWHDRRRRPTHLLPGTRETEAERRSLWDVCVALTSITSKKGQQSWPDTEPASKPNGRRTRPSRT